MQVILCGFNWTGCRALDILLENNCQVFVYTHTAPYHMNDLKNYCLKKNVPFSTENISIENLPFKPDVICSIYYRNIISDDIINSCDGKIFNLHPSLLPDYKGCSSLTWAMISGEEYTGYSYHYLTARVDGGDIIFQERMKLEEYDTQVSLYYRVMFKAMERFYEMVLKVYKREKGITQEKKGKYFKRGAPYKGVIDQSWDNKKVERFIRAMIFPPLPAAQFNGKEITMMDTYLQMRKEQDGENK